jgi:hypothetical protein
LQILEDKAQILHTLHLAFVCVSLLILRGSKMSPLSQNHCLIISINVTIFAFQMEVLGWILVLKITVILRDFHTLSYFVRPVCFLRTDEILRWYQWKWQAETLNLHGIS